MGKFKTTSSLSREDREDVLAQTLIDSINNKKKKTGISTKAYRLDDPNAPTHVTSFIPTGSTILDICISNRANGGIPIGKITELSGQEGSGKSALAASIAGNVQKMGGIAVYIDTEAAVTIEFFNSLGVDTKTLVYIPCETVEETFGTLEELITTIRSTDSDKPVAIIVDSIAALSSEQEKAADFSKQGYNTHKAIVISMAMRKLTNLIARENIAIVFTNQVRQKMNAVPFGKQYHTPGGEMWICLPTNLTNIS